jgi:hypothetical protein
MIAAKVQSNFAMLFFFKQTFYLRNKLTIALKVYRTNSGKKTFHVKSTNFSINLCKTYCVSFFPIRHITGNDSNRSTIEQLSRATFHNDNAEL